MTNVYLLKGKNGYLLIDGGQNFAKVDKQITKNKISWNDIKFIMITHHHSDHVNALGQILGKTDATIIIHKNEVKPLETGELDRKIFPLNRRVKFLMGIISLSISKKIKLRNKDVILESDSDFLRNYGINGTILETPGHTIGSLSLLMDNGNAYIGDAAMNFMKFLGLRKRPMIAEDYAKVFESWEKLLNLGAKKLYPSHGASFSVEELSKRLAEFKNN
jgi:glyoxylase-like metal-dependent hydrolase (beta-lactamase superfamily II)